MGATRSGCPECGSSTTYIDGGGDTYFRSCDGCPWEDSAEHRFRSRAERHREALEKIANSSYRWPRRIAKKALAEADDD